MSSTLDQLRKRLPDCLASDRHRLGRQLHQLRSQYDAARLAQLEARIDHSCAVVAKRRALAPTVHFPPELPVSQKIDDIRTALENHQVVVVAGETGSGKTTQLPKLCLQMGRGTLGRIGHTQPRRLAARSVANRLMEELDCQQTSLVGFQVRFTDTSSEESRIKLMTDGILLAEIRNDPFLNQYDTLIIDEAHERSLNIDFLLGYLKRLLPKRPDLKLVITSATIDVEKFSRHFDKAPVIEVSGRTYPVEMEYRPGEDAEGENLPEQVLEVVREIMQRDRKSPQKYKDILVFLTGERDIRDVADTLRKSDLAHTEILPLYARLSASEQDRIFKSHAGRRIVLATNVAETSLTVPGIGYVIDGGTARISRYSVRSKVQRLPIEPISQASARQRAGRCGRLAPGVCYRLYSENDFLGRPEFTDTEIMRTHLGSVILQMLSLGLGDIRDFPFLDNPEDKAVSDGYRLLEELGAVEGDRQLTQTGRVIAKIPVDPKLARILLEAGRKGCLHELLIIASALSMQDPRERPLDKQQAADEKQRQWQHPDSDFLAFVNLWNDFEKERQELTQNQLRKYCQKHFLSWMRMREWRELHRQLLLVCKDLKFTLNKEPADYASVHQSLLTGLVTQVAHRLEEGGYLAVRNRKFQIFPGSVLHRKKTKWILSAELVETTQLYARTNAKVEPEWIEAIAGPLLKHDYLEPHWSKRQGRVMAWEKVSLYGLVLVEKRRVAYSAIDAVVSREIFIREALVAGELNTRAAFYHHNLQLMKEIESLEEKTRRRDILVDETVLAEVYDQQLPAQVFDARSLEQWINKQKKNNPKILFFTRELLERDAARAPEQEHFPDQIQSGSLNLPLNYAFNPGAHHDGVSVKVPVSALRQLDEHVLDWLVPGMLRDKCIALVKSLPKNLRKHFVPVPDSVDKILPKLSKEQGALVVQLAVQLEKIAGTGIPVDAFADRLEEHLHMNIAVTDAEGKVLGSSRNLTELKQQFAGKIESELKALDSKGFQKKGLVSWSFDELPAEHVLCQAGHEIRAYPALVDDGDSVSLILMDDAHSAKKASEKGVTRLYMLATPQQLRYLKKEVLRNSGDRLALSLLGNFDSLHQQLIRLAYCMTFQCDDIPRTRGDFEQRLRDSISELVATASKLENLLLITAREFALIQKALRKANSLPLLPLQKAVSEQLSQLISESFPSDIPARWLPEYPRYLKAIGQRMEKFNADPRKDAELEKELKQWWQKYEARKAENERRQTNSVELEEFRWLLEEYRVSLFAQQLGTKVPVSGKRLEKYWMSV